MHTKEKPFACTMCPFKNASTSNLYSHIRKKYWKYLLDNSDYKRFSQKVQQEYTGDIPAMIDNNMGTHDPAVKVEQNTHDMHHYDYKIDQNTDGMEQNTDEMHHYDYKMDQNTDVVEQNTDGMHQNGSEMEQNTDDMEQNTDEMEQNTDEMEQNTDEMEQNILMTWSRMLMTWNRRLMTWNRILMRGTRITLRWGRILMVRRPYRSTPT